MPTPSDIIGFVEARTGHSLREDEAITFGPRTAELTGVTVCWMADPASIAAAVDAGHNCIVHHEALTFPYPAFTTGRERHYLSWPANVQRLGSLARHGLTAIRLHGSADELYVQDAFAEQLGLGPAVSGGPGWSPTVYASPTGTFGELTAHVKRAMAMEAVRTTCDDPRRPVSRIAVACGGLGLFVNAAYVQEMVDLGADTLICGETDNYGFRFAAESGMGVIETSHELGEAAGLRMMARRLGDALGIDVAFVETPCIWRTA